MSVSTFIFDLDGTLSNPLQGMANSLNYALLKHGFAEQSSASLGQYVGPPLETSLATLCGSNNPELISNLVGSYRERYLASGFAQNTLYDGIEVMLQTLQQNNIRMGVCTSKTVMASTKILELFKLDHYFAFVSGGDVGVKKSQQLAHLLESRQIDSDALMIGDRAIDIIAAKSNGLQSASVSWGYGSATELDAAAPHYRFDAPADIIQLAGCQSPPTVSDPSVGDPSDVTPA